MSAAPFRSLCNRQALTGTTSTRFQPLLLLVIFLFFFVLTLIFMLLLLLLVYLLLLFVLHSMELAFSGDPLSLTLFAPFGTGCSSGAALESFLPPSALATMVLFIKFLTIMLGMPVFTPIRILPLKTLPVLRPPLIPRRPSRTIPVFGSDNITGRISVIWSPTVVRAVKIVQDAIQKPITVVIDPRRIRPHPW